MFEVQSYHSSSYISFKLQDNNYAMTVQDQNQSCVSERDHSTHDHFVSLEVIFFQFFFFLYFTLRTIETTLSCYYTKKMISYTSHTYKYKFF